MDVPPAEQEAQLNTPKYQNLRFSQNKPEEFKLELAALTGRPELVTDRRIDLILRRDPGRILDYARFIEEVRKAPKESPKQYEPSDPKVMVAAFLENLVNPQTIQEKPRVEQSTLNQ